MILMKLVATRPVVRSIGMSLKPKVSRNNVLNQMIDEIGILGLKTSKLCII